MMMITMEMGWMMSMHRDDSDHVNADDDNDDEKYILRDICNG